MKRVLSLVVLATILTGCASLGNEPAQTFNQRLAYAEGVHTAVLDAATSSISAGTVSSASGLTILNEADKAQVALNAAEAAHAAGDEAGANAKLVTALAALQALQDFLRSQGGAK